MKTSAHHFLAILVIGLGAALSATSPGASSEHFLLVNDNDSHGTTYGTELKLLGNQANLTLMRKGTFSTGGTNDGNFPLPDIQMIQHGPDICMFLADSLTMDIASFLYPSLVKVGNYTDSAVTSSWLGIVLAAQGNYLFAAYDGQTSQDGQIGVWRIEHGCTLSLVNTYTGPYAAFSMAVSPDGKALVISYFTNYYVGSYGIGPGGALTGPYQVFLSRDNGFAPYGIDITADSKYALIDLQSDYTAVDVFPINSDGSLDTSYYSFGGNEDLGTAVGGGWIRLSPDQKLLFVNDNGEHITTLNFSETPVTLTYTGCITTLRVPHDEPSVAAYGMATELPSGDGSVLYVAETGNLSHIGTLAINASTGCTTETSGSPFQLTDKHASAESLAAWPPRSF